MYLWFVNTQIKMYERKVNRIPVWCLVETSFFLIEKRKGKDIFWRKDCENSKFNQSTGIYFCMIIIKNKKIRLLQLKILTTKR